MKRIWLFTFVFCWVALTEGLLSAAATLTTLHIFHNIDGNAPVGTLVLATNGNLYGVTTYGGTGSNCISGCGTVFEISPSGAFTSLHSFTNYDGSSPQGGLVQASDGNLYGTTSAGGMLGPGGLGSVFQITLDGQLTMIHSFGTHDGFDPSGALIVGPDNALYGTTPVGGTIGVGTVYRITTNGVLSVLNGVDQSAAGLVLASDGNFYGTTQFGGSSTNCTYGCGTVFRITPTGEVTTLHSFDGSDGKEPIAGLIQARDGNLYGTASGGQPNGLGVVFRITTNGDFAVIHSFSGPDGRHPSAELMQGSDGNLYGTTSGGGGSLFGSVFQITTNGTFTKLIAFNASNGANPAAGLVEGPDGALYGTTQGGGATNGTGTVFKLKITTNNTTSVSCVLAPATVTNVIGSTQTIVATVTSNNVPRVGASISFSIGVGPNTGQSRITTTDASGQASFTYTGALLPGTDIVHALSLGAAANAEVVWLAVDTVGDGVPDAWRAAYFGGDGTTTNAQSCAACDGDGTGQDNLFKYIAGLNPTNPASVFVLDVQDANVGAGQTGIVYGPRVFGRTYTPQFATNLNNGSWAKLTGFSGVVTNTDHLLITDKKATQNSKYYRIQISLP